MGGKGTGRGIKLRTDPGSHGHFGDSHEESTVGQVMGCGDQPFTNQRTNEIAGALFEREIDGRGRAFATADVGIAIGAGTDVAVESAGIVLVRSDPRDVVGAIQLSQATYRKMVQNLVWATGYNLIAIPIAMGVLSPWGIDLSMAVGAIAMSASTIVVAANAQLLRRLRLQRGSVLTEPALTSA
jgi:hypothetical protein